MRLWCLRRVKRRDEGLMGEAEAKISYSSLRSLTSIDMEPGLKLSLFPGCKQQHSNPYGSDTDGLVMGSGATLMCVSS